MSNPPTPLEMALWTFSGPAADVVRNDRWEVAHLARVLAEEFIRQQADLALARAVLDSASISGPPDGTWRQLLVDRAAWQAWQKRGKVNDER